MQIASCLGATLLSNERNRLYMFANPGFSTLSRIGLSILAYAVWSGSGIFAGDFNEKTMVSFAAPVQIPGQALPAGTYVFKLLDTSTENNVIQVFNKDETHLYATVIAVPDYRLATPARSTFLLFDERPSDTPEAIRAIFCRGDHYGRQFVYPHSAALDIARRSHQKVLQMRDETSDTSGLKKGEITGVDESGQPIDMKQVVNPSKPNK